MGYWKIDTEALARGRFAVSPLAETVASTLALRSRRKQPGLEEWQHAHQRAFREFVAEDGFAQAFLDAAFRPRWNADFVVAPPYRTDRTFHDELRHVRETPRDVALADLGTSRAEAKGTPLDVPDLANRCADILEWVWTHMVRPDWTRRRWILESDIVARTHQLSSHGWAAALEGLGPGVRWLGDGRLRINALDNPPREIADAELLFIPSATRHSWVGWDEPHRYAVVYPCSGVLASPEPATTPTALRRLIGPARASVLALLEAPKSTSQLVALTGYTLGSVGGHLRIMLDAGLVRRSRSGRSVLYYRTPLGDDLARDDA
ncbi:ArsR/SmtB family transcription factor [Solicola gregarius]|uniref:Helix-turn-helix domain-containing protein n=1 Tax=Solicola gregarius TaxID=2908642 RepID=A0AA46TK61_9ACTN|nr:helix-turn-helix domain-containing protein [Solicola gregarius]UYM06817.1 helix-turn-helix domain-containing protein [Solicola gregarius]